jgi:thymidylate synthase (FAD)
MSEDKITRVESDELNKILGYTFKVLDDGFIRVVDYMGSDESIVQAARVSYGKGTKKLSEDRGLIRYLLRHYHTTPFEMCEIKLHVRVPMDCWRQWIRHRTANVNEYSTRYSIAIDSAQKTDETEWRIQSSINKQGSGENLDTEVGKKLSHEEALLHEEIRRIYDERINVGVAREQARKDLPLSTYTEAYWKIDLHNLFHFLALRMDSHAQYEIRSYANVIGNEIVSKWCPLAWEAFKNYRLNALHLSNIEISVLRFIVNNEYQKAADYLISQNLLSFSDGKLKHSREFNEIEKKLHELNISINWQAYFL